MGLSNELSCDAGSLSRCRLNPQGVFNQRFEALFPCAGALGLCSLFRSPFIPPGSSAWKCGTTGSTSHHLEGSASCSLPASCRLACSSQESAASLGQPVTILPRVLSGQLCVSAPPTHLVECVFFNSLVVRLPCSSIFCQFWLFFVFKLLFYFFWLCEEAQCVYLCLHLISKSELLTI